MSPTTVPLNKGIRTSFGCSSRRIFDVARSLGCVCRGWWCGETPRFGFGSHAHARHEHHSGRSQLNSRPRRIGRCAGRVPRIRGQYSESLVQLKTTFKEKSSDACVTVWSSWSRQYDDGISNAVDRWYGPRGLGNGDPAEYQNALYIAEGAHGMLPLHEIAPMPEQIADGWFYHSKHLDMFWSIDNANSSNKSYLDTKFQAHGIDTIVVCGLWTDECILSTAFARLSRGYDVAVVRDTIATETANGPAALTVIHGTCGKVLTTQQVRDYLINEFVVGAFGAVKGTQHLDGRM